MDIETDKIVAEIIGCINPELILNIVRKYYYQCAYYPGNKLYQIYEKLVPFADKDNANGIIAMCCLFGCRFSEHAKYVDDTRLGNYLTKLQCPEMMKIINFANSMSIALSPHLLNLIIKMISDENSTLRTKIMTLENEIKYAPGGQGYLEAKKEFASVINSTNAETNTESIKIL